MSMSRTRGWAMAVAVPALALAVGCKAKEQPVAQATPPPTTVAPATTTLPPPPTTVATPPPVWRAARWGMTRKDVLAAFPAEAEKLATAQSFAQPQPGSSLMAGSSDVGITSYEMEG